MMMKLHVKASGTIIQKHGYQFFPPQYDFTIVISYPFANIGMLLWQVRNETTDDFLELLKEWEKLCKTYVKHSRTKACVDSTTESNNETPDCSTVPPEEFEVWKLVDICFGDPNKVSKHGLYFKVCKQKFQFYSYQISNLIPFQNYQQHKFIYLPFDLII